MFSFKKQPELFKLTLTVSFAAPRGTPRLASPPGETPEDGQQHELSVEWNSAEGSGSVLQRVAAALSAPQLVRDHVVLQVGKTQLLDEGSTAAVAAVAHNVHVSLSIEASRPHLVAVELLRTQGGGTLDTALVQALWGLLSLETVTRLRATDGCSPLWEEPVLPRLQSLRVLNLSHCGLVALPGAVGALASLQELRVVGNQLRMLPPEIGKLQQLRILAADNNQLTILPGELRHCTLLEELTLESNRLTSVLLNFAELRRLQVLHLYNNPLDFLPEISPCGELRHLSVANLRVTADPTYSKFNVEVLPMPTTSSSLPGISLFDNKQGDKLRPIFALMLRRSSGHHALLAGALRSLAMEDPRNRELMAKQENGLQQLVLMALSDNPSVAEQTCQTLTLLAQHSATLAEAVADNDLHAVMRLLDVNDRRLQLGALQVLAAVALGSPVAGERAATPQVLASLDRLVAGSGDGNDAGSADQDLRTAALKAVGNLAFGPQNRLRLARQPALMRCVAKLASSNVAGALHLHMAAVRVLAILGENEVVQRAVGAAPPGSRGLRILSLDGGGMKGMATVQLLRELERRSGQRVHEMFDLIVGTSTGGLLAVALGLRQMSLDQCEFIYKVLGQKVFSRTVASKDKEESWMDSFYRTFHSKTQHVRAVVVGSKHDATVYEALLREYCNFAEQQLLEDSMIDTACLNAPKIALVSTLASVSPARPFVFRNYELPPGSEQLFQQIGAHQGSSGHAVWQAVRASSAATFYLEDFTCGDQKFQDGALTANNPAVIALQEARLLWPEHRIDTFVSLGVGISPPTRREKGLSGFLETGSILIESSTNVERAEEALATLLPLVPGCRYFRFCAEDARCEMELDEVDPLKWAALEAATQEYIAQQAVALDAATAALTQQETAVVQQQREERQQDSLRLGASRKLVVVRAPWLAAGPMAGGDAADTAALAVSRLPDCVGVVEVPSAGQQQVEAVTVLAGGLHPRASAPTFPNAAGAAPQPPAVPGEPAADGEEASGLSAYLSSWFSPTKTANLPQAPQQPGLAEPAADGASKSGGGRQLATALPPLKTGVLTSLQHASSGGLPSGRTEDFATPLASAGQAAPLLLQAHGEGVAELQALLDPLLPAAGVLHLALQPSTHGLVLQWEQRLEAVAEPSARASALLEEAGQPPSATLSQLFLSAPSLPLGGGTVSALSHQSQWVGGQQLSLFLLQFTAPAEVLAPSSVVLLRNALAGQLVVSAAPLPADLLHAVLAAGAKGVVCTRASSDSEVPEVQPSGAALAGFFTAFYSTLLGGTSVSRALRKAEEQQPELDGAFAIYTLSSEGQVV